MDSSQVLSFCRRTLTFIIAALVGSLLHAVAVAQTDTVTTLRPAPPSLVPPRPESDIQRDLDAAKARVTAVEQQLAAVRTDLETSKARTKVKKQEVELAKDRVREAKKAKREAERLGNETALKAEETWLKVSERKHEVEKGQISALEKRLELVHGTIEALQLEHELVLRRVERTALEQVSTAPGAPERAMVIDRTILELERRTLESMSSNASREGDVAKQEKSLAERRLKLLEAWSKAVEP